MSTSIPTTQTAAQINAHGGPEVVEINTSAPVPTPTPTELLIKNEYAGINYIDTYLRSGLYPVPKFPYTLGREAEGTVVSVGADVQGFEVGDRVAYLAADSQAQYTVTAPLHVAHIPEGLSPGLAAASMIQGITALTLVRESYEVKKGDYILVHAAAGGVGLWLCQILRIIGAHTIATASTAEKLELAKANGAEHLINYSSGDWVEETLKITENKGVAAVFDGVGKSTFEGDLQVLARKGSLVSFGNASGAVPPFAIGKLSAKNLKVLRPHLFGYIATREEFDKYTSEIFGWIKGGEIDVRIHKEYPLKDVRKAQEDIESRKTTGKLIIKI